MDKGEIKFKKPITSASKRDEFKPGDVCFAWYPDQYNKLELFYCVIKSMGRHYCEGELFFDEDLKVRRGLVNDICIPDLSALESPRRTPPQQQQGNLYAVIRDGDTATVYKDGIRRIAEYQIMKQMKTQHTPGPLEIGYVLGRTIQDELFYYEVYHYSGPIRSRIATAYGKDQQEAEANAKIIAAAPELLEALQSLNILFTGKEHWPEVIQALNAIKKATE